MAAIPTKDVAKTEESLEQQFRRLEKLWNAETAHLSSMSKIVNNTAFQEIIQMGPDVVPFMLRDMEERPRQWVCALPQILGVDPVPEPDRGNIERMSQAWLKWAKENGYQW